MKYSENKTSETNHEKQTSKEASGESEIFMKICEIHLDSRGFTLTCDLRIGEKEYRDLKILLNPERVSSELKELLPEYTTLQYNMKEAMKKNSSVCGLFYKFLQHTIDFEEVMRRWKKMN